MELVKRLLIVSSGLVLIVAGVGILTTGSAGAAKIDEGQRQPHAGVLAFSCTINR
jgi:hypothetical protein